MPEYAYQPPNESQLATRPSSAAPTLATLAILLILASYTGGYFLLGNRTDFYFPHKWPDDPPPELVCIERKYPYKWLKTIYQPAGKIETWLRKNEVDVVWRGETIIRNYF